MLYSSHANIYAIIFKALIINTLLKDCLVVDKI